MPIGIHDGHGNGESHPMAKLTDEVVREIRKSSESNDALAARFRTCVSNVWIRGRTWRHVDQ